MYISKINIKNYKNFSDSDFNFSEGTNVIIGHNNAGKTNLIKALQLVFDHRKAKHRLSVDDFNKQYTDFSKPPEINITVTLKEQPDEPKDDKVVVYDWFTKPDALYEAQLTFSFFLPQGDDYKEYSEEIKKYKKDDKFDSKIVWNFIKKNFFKKYVTRIYGGNPEKKEKADSEMLKKFDFQFLDAIRDAERQMFFGNNTILKEVLNYFLDFDITKGEKLKDLEEKGKKELKDRVNKFDKNSNTLFKNLIKRISKDEILKYAKETGASKGGNPDFDAYLTEEDLLFALRLIIEIDGMKIPISNNGLGYNNLLYTALILAKMQIECQRSYYGENAKVFPILAIEEPEAHLHPSMQYKFLNFLNNNINKEGKVRQLFVTTHSTHVTSAVDLDNVICLYKNLEGKDSVGYPGRTFGKSIESKNYVKRFLDATKSNMLFADKIILVEGLAEQLLLPCFAAYSYYDEESKITYEDELINQHVCTVSVDSRTFKHFLKLYSYSKENPNAIQKRIVCITDVDPEIKGRDNKWRGCFPFQLKNDENSKKLATHVTDLKNNFQNKFNNILIFHPEEGKGKTLEYELARFNPQSELIITDSFPKQNSPHTRVNFKTLQETDQNNPTEIINRYKALLTSQKQKDKFDILEKAISESSCQQKDKPKAIISAIYYNIVKSLKGEHALYLADNLRKDIERKTPEFNVPDYINDAIIKVLE